MGPHSIVYRANVAGAKIFLKISTNEQSFEDLTHDADAYLCKALIPYFHGYYKNEKPAAYLNFWELSREGKNAQMRWPTDLVCTYLSVAALDMDLLPNIKYPLVTIGNVSYLALSYMYPPKPIIDTLLPD
ncbi:hypothetical protein EDD85DRAFT_790434 [Armillaria nabsnona]|nr:hypothetical protein EDD85DRAFT_790434 [Armillaria nabsnona]